MTLYFATMHANSNVSISFSCPTCKRKLTVDQRAAGKKIVCPACRARIQIPKLEASPSSSLEKIQDTPFSEIAAGNRDHPAHVRHPSNPLLNISLTLLKLNPIAGSLIFTYYGNLYVRFWMNLLFEVLDSPGMQNIPLLLKNYDRFFNYYLIIITALGFLLTASVFSPKKKSFVYPLSCLIYLLLSAYLFFSLLCFTVIAREFSLRV